MTTKKSIRNIGLTGGVGSGKSTVLNVFKKKGAECIDADKIVHQLLKKNSVLREVKKKFGSVVVGKGLKLDKKALASIVFSSTKQRKSLERILHSKIRHKLLVFLKIKSKRRKVFDIPLLYERGWQNKFDAVIVVDASLKKRINRLRKKGWSLTDIQNRIHAQMPLSIKRKKTKFLINNNGSIRDTQNQVNRIWSLITK